MRLPRKVLKKDNSIYPALFCSVFSFQIINVEFPAEWQRKQEKELRSSDLKSSDFDVKKV